MKGMKFDKWKFLISHKNDEIQARAVNGGSNYDSLKVAKCLVI